MSGSFCLNTLSAMQELELLVQQLETHITSESERIRCLKDFCAALDFSRTATSLQFSHKGGDDEKEQSLIEEVTDNPNQLSRLTEPHFEKLPLQRHQDLLSTLGQYQVKRDEFDQERRREYQEYLKRQNLETRRTSIPKRSGHQAPANFDPSKDRNELDKERRKLQDEKYRKELKKQIEENRARREFERQNEMYAQRLDELRLQHEIRKMAIDKHPTEHPINVAEEISAASVLNDRNRSPSYLHVNRPQKTETPIKLRPLLDAFSRSMSSVEQGENGGGHKRGSPGMVTLSHVRNKMLHDHKELMSKLHYDLTISH